MNENERAQELCEKLGITEEREKNMFYLGYKHGVLDQKLEGVHTDIERLRKNLPKSGFPDAETR